MKKAVFLFAAVVFFAGMTFAQNPQVQDKSKTETTKTETSTTKKDDKGCEKTCTHHKGKSCSDKEKAGGCHKKSSECKKDATTTTPEKK